MPPAQPLGSLDQLLRIAAGEEQATVALLHADDVSRGEVCALGQQPQEQVDALAFEVVEADETQGKPQQPG